MNWWCAASRVPWSWQPRAYPGVWIFIASIAAAAIATVRKTGIRPTRRQRMAGWGGLLLLWIASDWPVGTLGSGYLASAHMFQYLMYTFMAAPLLVLSVPEALARRVLAKGRLYRAYRALANPVAAAITTNLILVITHAPLTVDTFRATQLGSFGLDILWLLGGLTLWLPICGPIPEAKPTYPVRGVYLFVAAGIVPMVPGGFLTFAEFPLYRMYELAPRVGGLDPVTDQQLAGVVMKIGSVPFVWPVIATMFWRWTKSEERRPRRPQPSHSS